MVIVKTMTQLVIAAYKGKYRAQKEIDAKQLEIEAIEHRMSGLSRLGTPMTPEQEKSSLPMPKTVSHDHSDQRFLSGLERKDELEREIDFLQQSTGKEYRDHYATLLYWADQDARKEAEAKAETKPDWYSNMGDQSPTDPELLAEINKLRQREQDSRS